MSGDRMDVDEKEHISHSTSEKLEATLSDVVSLLGLFAELTDELSKGKDCNRQVVEEASRASVEKVKVIRSVLRSVVPTLTSGGKSGASSNTTGYSSSSISMDSYLERAQANVAVDMLKLCQSHVQSMKRKLEGEK